MLSKTLQLGAAGNAGSSSLYVDDVFSIDVFDGNGSSQTITNGIDLAGEGGMVWGKTRTTAVAHTITDTERGVDKELFTNTSDSEVTRATGTGSVTAFNSNGFTTHATNGFINYSGHNACSWTFRKCPGFFDVVTYTGNGTSGRTVSHSLGSVPGCIIIKRLDVGTDWLVYHRGLDSSAPEDYRIVLNSDAARESDEFNIAWNSTAPTATQFTLGTYSRVNANGGTYVAYIFAHNDQSFGTDGDEAIIKCGSYTGAGANQQVDVGFEPQWLLIKGSSNGGDWSIYDSMRTGDNVLFAQSSNAETDVSNTKAISILSDGFQLPSTEYGDLNASGRTYIYVAIRRPHKPPEAGTEVFATDTQNSGPYNAPPYYRSGFVVDAQLLLYKTGTSSAFPWLSARLTGNKNLVTAITSAEDSNSTINKWDFMNGFSGGEIFSDDSNHVSHMFRRAPGFFDVVAYTGTGSSSSHPHNLGVRPELKIIKRRDSTTGWLVHSHHVYGDRDGFLNLDTDGSNGFPNYWDQADTATTFSVRAGNSWLDASGGKYIAYLFASLDGISKVGSYTGTGNNLSVNCGFAAGARFVLIKRVGTGDWWVFDTARGIVSSGNDPALRLNLSNPEVTSTDYLEPNSNGFTVTSTAGAGLNANGGTYLYLAIA